LRTSKPLKRLAADANVILSAAAGKAALRLFLVEGVEFVTTSFNIEEVGEYLSMIARKYSLSETVLQSQLKLLPLTIYDRSFYDDYMPKASKKLSDRDPEDIELLALALKLKAPVWTNDRHFKHTGIEVYTTAQLLKIFNV
jgi:predicted nucleic acid-binding protein